MCMPIAMATASFHLNHFSDKRLVLVESNSMKVELRFFVNTYFFLLFSYFALELIPASVEVQGPSKCFLAKNRSKTR